MPPGAQPLDTLPTSSDAWPHEEARRLQERIRDYPLKRPVIFESGFGPSGLPHLGTMCEVLRPAYVRKAFAMTEPARASRLIVFIDDMDGLRKAPDHPVLNFHMGKLLMAEHNRKAISYLEKAYASRSRLSPKMADEVASLMKKATRE